MRYKGKITKWDDDKGFGFITPSIAGENVFIHISAFNQRKKRPEINQTLSYQIETDKSGRLRAKKAKLLDEKVNTKGLFSIVIAVSFFLIISYLTHIEKMPLMTLEIYCGVSVLTFLVYAFDKSAAKKGGWRISENKLHLLALAGGWPGAIFAQQLLQHKSTKQTFRFVFWITVLLNLGVYTWFFVPNSMELFQLYRYKMMFIFSNYQHYFDALN